MIRMKQFIAFLFIAACTFSNLKAQNVLSPRANAQHGNVSVDYGQPSKRGRVVFGGLEPYDQVWRTGANEATTITFKKDGTFGGKAVKAGKYTLFTIPREKEWEFILNSKTDQWGAYEYEKIKGSDVLHVVVPSKQKSDVTEVFTITVTAEALTLAWDQTEVSVPIKF